MTIEEKEAKIKTFRNQIVRETAEKIYEELIGILSKMSVADFAEMICEREAGSWVNITPHGSTQRTTCTR